MDFGLCVALPLKVRFHVDDPDGPHVQSYADRFLEVNVEGEWGLVCFEPLNRSDLTVLCRDLEGKFGQWSRPGTPRYYGSTKRLVHTLGTFPTSSFTCKQQESVVCVHVCLCVWGWVGVGWCGGVWVCGCGCGCGGTAACTITFHRFLVSDTQRIMHTTCSAGEMEERI